MTIFALRPLSFALIATLLASCSSSPDKLPEPQKPVQEITPKPVKPVVVKPKAPPIRSNVASRMPSARAGNGKSFAGNAQLNRFIKRMVSKHGFNQAKLTQLFSQVKHETWISNYMNRQRPSKKKLNPNGSGWSKYRPKFVKASKINKGVQFWRQNNAALQRASQQYGVPAEYIVAIIGVETNYGSNFGKFRVIDALTTIGLTNKRRGKSFLKYLEDFLVMARKEGMNPLRPVGSHAGAMGYGQFMPSSFLSYAVDFDGNGRRDLWHPTDAIGSIANYFKRHGWRSGEAVAVRTSAVGKRYQSLNSGFKSNYSAATLKSYGVKTNFKLKHSGRTSLVILPTHAGGEVWLGYNNFYVISRYNHSTYYSMAVHQLAKAIKKQRGK